ncbi:periplasmic chaperone for outer membrane proteins Skp [Saccharicrinis carchari]|uniref:Periplasmic chaperone for outer membrane proteins Skp n=1 Tax=Saccharicrinis carchari TaxID=1168039 RepID=A0A521AE75_SACCC|nr:OmpH family outer membrane protein [Saccharicrinis carchari]SMO33107.1 periplasmic chaperone for outer membrane proteins Skp [Saccharicrinis carchari]
MKRNRQVVNFALLLGMASMIFASCQTEKREGEPAQQNTVDKLNENGTFPVAYIDTDSLLRQYGLAIHLQEELLKKEEKSRTDFNEQAKKLQAQMTEFQRKVQNNGFLSRERAEQEQRNLMARDQELQNLNTKLSQELMGEQESLNRQLRDTLSNYLEEFNADGRYKLILSNIMGDNVLYSAPGINITKQVSEALNKRYESSKNKKSKTE